ncbi:putative transporter [Rosistilla ulvae]|uniref:Putative transporter n=1 Tax=Rosistilla ulvae TaxID=1930277 RepID=A0A517M2Y7_9BACT|nr:MFS transporter [Rosistilla ulvae]QDS89236.1 putative transporter [Rosistilla ulvae]
MDRRSADVAETVTEATEKTPRLYDRNFMLALASQMCFVIANTLMAHYSRWIEFLGGDLGQVGMIMGASATLGLFLRPWIAQWINRLGSRTMWLYGYLLFSFSAVANVCLDDLNPLIYAIRACTLLAAAIVFASGLTYISQTAPEHRRTEAIGVLGAGGFVGMLIGPWLGDLILGNGAETALVARQRADFVWLFLVAGGSSLLPALFLLMMRTPASNGTRRSVKLSDFVATTLQYWPGAILLVDFVFGVCMTAPFIFVASFIDNAPLAIGKVSVIGIFFLCYAGWGVTVRLWLGDLPDRIGPHKILILGMASMAIGMFSYSLVSASHAWLIVVPALLTGTGHGMMFHTMTSLTIQPFPNEVRGTGAALAMMMLDLGTLVGAPVLGYVGDRLGFAALFATVGTICVLGLGVYVWRGDTSTRMASLSN